jgi:DNA-binding transcriptional MerR regulator
VKKLSEVCKIVGVTRRTLQEYDKVGLLHPSDKTEAGYWLYDENAIKQLIAIQVFIECGYERKKIKSILEMPSLDLLSEFDKLITALEEKRKRIDGMINTVKTLQITAKLPLSTLLAIQRMDVGNIYKEKSFSANLKEVIAKSASYDESEAKEAELYMPFWYTLVAIRYPLIRPSHFIRL